MTHANFTISLYLLYNRSYCRSKFYIWFASVRRRHSDLNKETTYLLTLREYGFSLFAHVTLTWSDDLHIRTWPYSFKM